MRIKIITLYSICSIGLYCCNDANKSENNKRVKEQSKSGFVKENKTSDIEKESQVKTKLTANSSKQVKKFIPPQVIFDPSVVDPMPPDPYWGNIGSIYPPMEGDELILDKPTDEEVFTIVEVNPEFNGGVNEMMKFLKEHIKYPEYAREIGIEGKVYIQFIVFKDGHLSDFKVIKKVHPTLDREALEVVQKMPNWVPGKNNGKSVNVVVVVPIVFKLS
ncbi:MAG: energy transducer TonB [Bacteroidota bacterium]